MNYSILYWTYTCGLMDLRSNTIFLLFCIYDATEATLNNALWYSGVG